MSRLIQFQLVGHASTVLEEMTVRLSVLTTVQMEGHDIKGL